jgi:hypothetical protein
VFVASSNLMELSPALPFLNTSILHHYVYYVYYIYSFVGAATLRGLPMTCVVPSASTLLRAVFGHLHRSASRHDTASGRLHFNGKLEHNLKFGIRARMHKQRILCTRACGNYKGGAAANCAGEVSARQCGE